jgi:hypothetical protein
MAAGAGDLTGSGRTGRTIESDANGESFGILVVAGIRLGIRRVQEETSAPQLRLACNHLQISFVNTQKRD